MVVMRGRRLASILLVGVGLAESFIRAEKSRRAFKGVATAPSAGVVRCHRATVIGRSDDGNITTSAGVSRRNEAAIRWRASVMCVAQVASASITLLTAAVLRLFGRIAECRRLGGHLYIAGRQASEKE